MNDEIGYLALGTLPDLREGWAIIPFVEKPHYWELEGWSDGADRISIYRSRCGVEAAITEPQKPIVPGNFPKCKKCAAFASRAMLRDEG